MAGATTPPAASSSTPPAEIARRRLSPFDYAAWLIDLDGTLYRQQPVRWVMALQVAAWGRSSVSVLREFRREHERLHHEELSVGSNPFELQIERTADRLGVTSDVVRTIVERWMFERPLTWLRLFRRRSLLTQIEQFRARGGKTAVVSDYPASRKLSAMGIASQFDAVVASGEPGGPRQLKPNPIGYLTAATALRVRPDQCLVIGDRADADGDAARRAEMDFWHVTSPWTS